MTDPVSGLNEQEIADLVALADGTLPAERAPAVEARVAASPQLQSFLERQQRAVAATRMLGSEPVPDSLRRAVEARGRTRERRRPMGLAPRFALAGALVAAIVVVAAVVLNGGPGAPSVADAARLATKPPNAPAPPPARGNTVKLAADVEGVAFPNLARFAGWRALGARRGHIDGRAATVVFYGKDGRRIAYVIVAGKALPRPSAGKSTSTSGVEYQTLRLNGRLAVTWRRGGRTCVLTGRATRPELLKLASWPA
jgi:anti-sigma factor RsiW